MNVFYFLYYNTFILNIFYIRTMGRGGKGGGKDTCSIAKKGQRARVVVGTKERTAGVEHMFSIPKEAGG